MAFSDFKTIPEVQQSFGIAHTRQDFLAVESSSPSEYFLRDFEFKQQHIDVFASEGARCEAIIFPILLDVYKGYADACALWIKKSIAYNETLSGTPDYFVSTRSELGMLVVGSPLILMVEAKKNDFESGWGQCFAELVAAQKINGNADIPVYGIVTDAVRWEFGRLVGDTFTQNRTGFDLDNLPMLFGAVNAVFRTATEVFTE